MVIVFSEPVQFISCPGTQLLSQNLNVTFRTCDPEYSDFGTKLLFNLSQTKFLNISSERVVESLLTTSPGELWLALENATVADVASVKNYMSSWELAESSPGEELFFLLPHQLQRC
jgi:hypothetical protein